MEPKNQGYSTEKFVLDKVKCPNCGSKNLQQTSNDFVAGVPIGWCKDCHDEWFL